MDASLATVLLALVLGILVGTALGWELGRRRAPSNATVVTDPAEVRLTLDRVERHLLDLERVRQEAYGELRAELGHVARGSEQLRVETQALSTALRAPHVRGRWGETQLRRVVEVAGMLEHCDFEEQPTMSAGDSVRRPDLVVHLADGKSVAVDAKVPLAAYLDALEAGDGPAYDELLRAHARQLRHHVDALADRTYWQLLPVSPEFVVLFVPADPFLAAALEKDPSLLEHAFSRNVVLATPSTLVALLRTVAHTWRQEAITANAQQVHRLGRELHQRLGVWSAHLTRVGSGLDTAVKAYNQAVGSLESRVLVTARKLADLDVVDDELATVEPLEVTTRTVSPGEAAHWAS